MKNHRIRCFFSDKIRPNLPDFEIRKIARKKYKQWASQLASREDQEIEPLHGVHTFGGVNRNPSDCPDGAEIPPEENKRRIALYGKIKSTPSPNRTNQKTAGSLYDIWQKVKAELAIDFALHGNQRFIDAVKKTETSRKRKNNSTRKRKALANGTN